MARGWEHRLHFQIRCLGLTLVAGGAGGLGFLSRLYFPAACSVLFSSEKLRANDVSQVRNLNRMQRGWAWLEIRHRTEEGWEGPRGEVRAGGLGLRGGWS